MSSDDPILLGDSDEEGEAGRPVEIPSSEQDVKTSSRLPTNELERRRAILAAVERYPVLKLYRGMRVMLTENKNLQVGLRRGRTAEEAVEIDSDIGTVGTVVEVSDKDVELLGVEDSDDKISISSTELRQREQDLRTSN